jgi:hypothetical protein
MFHKKTIAGTSFRLHFAIKSCLSTGKKAMTNSRDTVHQGLCGALDSVRAWRTARMVLSVLAVSLGLTSGAWAQTFSPTGNMNFARFTHQATLFNGDAGERGQGSSSLLS